MYPENVRWGTTESRDEVEFHSIVAGVGVAVSVEKDGVFRTVIMIVLRKNRTLRSPDRRS